MIRLLDRNPILVNQYPPVLEEVTFEPPGRYCVNASGGGLGWGLGAALGAKLAAPEQTVICAVGDGAYIFGAPTAAHWVSRAYNLPVLWVIFNNRAWNAVKRAVHGHAPDGWAVRTGTMMLS